MLIYSVGNLKNVVWVFRWEYQEKCVIFENQLH